MGVPFKWHGQCVPHIVHATYGRYATGSAYAPAASFAVKSYDFTLSPVAAFGAFRSANARKGIVVAIGTRTTKSPAALGGSP